MADAQNITVGRRWASAWVALRESFVAFDRNRGLETAATLAYFGFFSLLPLLLLTMFMLSRFVLSSDIALDAVRGASTEVFPQFGQFLVDELVRLAGQRVWSAFGALILFWSIIPLAGAIHGAMLRVFTPERLPTFVKARLRELAGAGALLLIFLLVVIGRIVYGTATVRLGIPVSAASQVLQWLGAFAMTVGALYGFYKLFAPVRVSPLEALAGALAASLLLFLFRPAFAAFLRYNPNYGIAFGSLKAIFLLIIWVYLTFAIVLYGAEVVAGARRRDVAVLRGFLAGGPARPGGRVSRAAVSRFLRFAAQGERLFEEGETGHVMYYVQSGEVELARGGRTLRRIGAGEYFGEIAMLIDSPRTTSASVVSANAELIVISRENFDQILHENPGIARAILREMASRLKSTDEQLSMAMQTGPAETPPPGSLT